MKVTYPTCCGVDVHKSFLVATIIKTTGGIEPSYQKKRFSTFNNSILEFKSWLLENDCHDVCMESTGKYWVPVFNLLEDQINVTIANPKWVKAVKGNKDDTKDSKWIGDLFRLGLVKGSYIPCKSIRILREYDLLGGHDSLTQFLNYTVFLAEIGQCEKGLAGLRRIQTAVLNQSGRGSDYAFLLEAMGTVNLFGGNVAQARECFSDALGM